MFDEDLYEDMDSDDEGNYQTSWSGEDSMSVIERDDNRISVNALRQIAKGDFGNPNYKSNHFSERGMRIDELLVNNNSPTGKRSTKE